MRMVVLDGHTLNPGDNSWEPLAALGDLAVYDRTPADQVVERGRDADIILINKTRLTAEALAELPRLRFVAVLATGFDVVDAAAARRRGIPVSNVPEYGTDSVAQHVFALLLELCHQVGDHNAAVHAGDWANAADFCFWMQSPIELAGLTMGLVGFGRIGQRVAALAQCFGMRVITASTTHALQTTASTGAAMAVTDLFASADVVSLHCPLTRANQRFVNRDLLGHMKAGAYFINTARGGLVDEGALAAALNAGQLAGAAVDVVSTEPIHPDNPLLHARNCIITPHMAWGSLAARRRLMHATVDNVRTFLAGRPVNVVN